MQPSDLQKSLIEEATFLRGKILTSYAQVEFLLADLSVKLDLKFPYRIQDRIKAAKRISERPGFETYKDELATVCDQLLEYDEIRNLMAHGFLMLTTDKKGNHKFDMRLYQREGVKASSIFLRSKPTLSGCAPGLTTLWNTSSVPWHCSAASIWNGSLRNRIDRLRRRLSSLWHLGQRSLPRHQAITNG